MNTIQIKCIGHDVAELDIFRELQGDLKLLPEKEYQNLRLEMIEQGFSFPVSVWKNGDTLWILDGHQRLRTLKRMRDEGFSILPLPYSVTLADNYEQAKLKCLAAASQYGKTNEAGLVNFLKDIKIEPMRLERFPLMNIDMPVFVKSHFKNREAPSFSPGSNADQGKLDEKKPVTCPHCGESFVVKN